MANHIILSGATGYLGSNLYDYFSNKKKACTVIGRDSLLNDDLVMDSKLIWDLSQPMKESMLEDIPMESVFVHCAAAVSQGIEESWAGNILATKHLLEIAKKRKGLLFIHISTGGVYGAQSDGYSNEMALPAPFNVYTSTKLISEELVQMYAREYGLNCVILRLYFPFGGKNEKGIFATIPRNIAQGKELIVHNEGAPFINPLHMDDIKVVIFKIMEKYSLGQGIKTYNICGDEVISFQEIINLFAQKMGKKPSLTYSQKTVGNILGDSTLIKNDLDWTPQKSVKSYILNEFNHHFYTSQKS